MGKLINKNLEDFFSCSSPIYYKKGETFLRPGEMPQGISFIKRGYVRLYSLSADGKDLTLVIYKPGDFFPVVWTFSATPSIYYFEAMCSVEIRRVKREDFHEFIEKNPDVFRDVVDDIIHRFQTALRRMEYLTFGNAGTKLASTLVACGFDFGSRKGNKKIKINIPFSHRDIANLIGVTRETVSIELKRLERKKVIAYTKDGHILIKNLTLLQKIASLV